METRVRQEGQWNPGVDPNGWRDGGKVVRNPDRRMSVCLGM